MKNIIITALLTLVAMTGLAQELRTSEPTLSDYLQLLNAKGYMAYSFDTKNFKDKQYEPVVMEYVKGTEAKDVLIGMNQKLALAVSAARSSSSQTFRQTSSNPFPIFTCLALRFISISWKDYIGRL